MLFFIDTLFMRSSFPVFAWAAKFTGSHPKNLLQKKTETKLRN